MRIPGNGENQEQDRDGHPCPAERDPSTYADHSRDRRGRERPDRIGDPVREHFHGGVDPAQDPVRAEALDRGSSATPSIVCRPSPSSCGMNTISVASAIGPCARGVRMPIADVRKIAYSLAIMLLLAACNSESTDKSTAEEQTKQEVVHMEEALLGKWRGMIEIPQSPLEIILNLKESSGSISVPAQGISDFAFESIKYNESDVAITINLGGSLIKIAGKLKNETMRERLRKMDNPILLR